MRLTPPYDTPILIGNPDSSRAVWRFGPGSTYPQGDYLHFGRMTVMEPADNTAEYYLSQGYSIIPAPIDPDLVMDEGL